MQNLGKQRWLVYGLFFHYQLPIFILLLYVQLNLVILFLFQGFNKELEEICRVQKGYAIPDSELREVLKRDNRDFVLPKYQAFFGKFAILNFTKNPEKYIKFKPEDVISRINNFFDAAA